MESFKSSEYAESCECLEREGGDGRDLAANVFSDCRAEGHTPLAWKEISKTFEIDWDLPHCVGALDGKHILLQAPAHSGSDFYNYKSNFSIVLLELVDGNYNFLFADVGCQGRCAMLWFGRGSRATCSRKTLPRTRTQLELIISLCSSKKRTPGGSRAAREPFSMRMVEVSMEQCRNEGAEETEDPRENPPTDGIPICENPERPGRGLNPDRRGGRRVGYPLSHPGVVLAAPRPPLFLERCARNRLPPFWESREYRQRRDLLASQTSLRLLDIPIRLATTQECSGETGRCPGPPRRNSRVGEDSGLPRLSGRQSLTEAVWPSVRDRNEVWTTIGNCGTTAGEVFVPVALHPAVLLTEIVQVRLKDNITRGMDAGMSGKEQRQIWLLEIIV
ncbi:hypothetical protein PR048_000690 [Dryococelus australis]|uniref:DDE Tnp4 domain-containing protein n=1 Tax=Dryococelus australis TaxID=614101 RepID=A0ABQ9IHP6_9NEOP|nr:hypothetical protein PR048_000690 [Dryococelus australis]